MVDILPGVGVAMVKVGEHRDVVEARIGRPVHPGLDGRVVYNRTTPWLVLTYTPDETVEVVELPYSARGGELELPQTEKHQIHPVRGFGGERFDKASLAHGQAPRSTAGLSCPLTLRLAGGRVSATTWDQPHTHAYQPRRTASSTRSSTRLSSPAGRPVARWSTKPS
jgi:hypothetical protein